MDLRRAWFIAAYVLSAATVSAVAQVQPVPQQQQPATSPWDQPSQSMPLQQHQQVPWPQQQQMPWPQQQQQKQQETCARDFGALRADAAKKAAAIQAASKNKVSPKEACALFNAFSGAEVKMIKYAQANLTTCDVPPQAIDQMKKSHANTDGIRVKVCQAAAAGPARPAAPSLSDALIAPVPDSGNIKTGRGTFDTLTGSPLGGK